MDKLNKLHKGLCSFWVPNLNRGTLTPTEIEVLKNEQIEEEKLQREFQLTTENAELLEERFQKVLLLPGKKGATGSPVASYSSWKSSHKHHFAK